MTSFVSGVYVEPFGKVCMNFVHYLVNAVQFSLLLVVYV